MWILEHDGHGAGRQAGRNMKIAADIYSDGSVRRPLAPHAGRRQTNTYTAWTTVGTASIRSCTWRVYPTFATQRRSSMSPRLITVQPADGTTADRGTWTSTSACVGLGTTCPRGRRRCRLAGCDQRRDLAGVPAASWAACGWTRHAMREQPRAKLSGVGRLVYSPSAQVRSMRRACRLYARSAPTLHDTYSAVARAAGSASRGADGTTGGQDGGASG